MVVEITMTPTNVIATGAINFLPNPPAFAKYSSTFNYLTRLGASRPSINWPLAAPFFISPSTAFKSKQELNKVFARAYIFKALVRLEPTEKFKYFLFNGMRYLWRELQKLA
jgi:hypothetical protein